MAAYEKIYLNDNKKLTSYLFHLFMESPYDYFECIKEYMSNSEIRKKMDEGNWSALNKGIKQLYNSVNFECISFSDNSYMDGILSDWIAEVYVFLQWKYELSSSEVVSVITPEMLYEIYNPLHEISLENACEKLYLKYMKGTKYDQCFS